MNLSRKASVWTRASVFFAATASCNPRWMESKSSARSRLISTEG